MTQPPTPEQPTAPHGQPTGFIQPTPTLRRRRMWPWITAAMIVVIAAAGGTAFALAGDDPGVIACERSADRAASGRTASASDDGDVQLLKDSRHADLREVGETIEQVAADGDLSDAMRVGVQMMAACARHGVVIEPA